MANTGKRSQETRVTHAQFYAVCEFLKNISVENRIDMTYEEIKGVCNGHFDFPLSTFTVREAVKTSGVEAKVRQKGGKVAKTDPAVIGAIADLQEEVSKLRRRNAWFQKTIENLADHVNYDLGNDRSDH